MLGWVEGIKVCCGAIEREMYFAGDFIVLLCICICLCVCVHVPTYISNVLVFVFVCFLAQWLGESHLYVTES